MLLLSCRRHPTRWVLPSSETQHSVWGAHAWAGCFQQPLISHATVAAPTSASEPAHVSAQTLHTQSEASTGTPSSSECPGASSSQQHTHNAIPGSGLKRKAQAEASEDNPAPGIQNPQQALSGSIPASLAASTEPQVRLDLSFQTGYMIQ